MFYPVYIFDDDPDYEIFTILEFTKDDISFEYEVGEKVKVIDLYSAKHIDLFNDGLGEWAWIFDHEYTIDEPELLKDNLYELDKWIMERFWDWWD